VSAAGLALAARVRGLKVTLIEIDPSSARWLRPMRGSTVWMTG
jgi:hypothetical protein